MDEKSEDCYQLAFIRSQLIWINTTFKRRIKIRKRYVLIMSNTVNIKSKHLDKQTWGSKIVNT